MKNLIKKIRECVLCKDYLPYGPKPLVQLSASAKIIIIGQAPAQITHQIGVPWNDKSGERLREWLGVTKEQFYDPDIFALMPMGFCYPGKGKTGDLPPRKECAPYWHDIIMEKMTHYKIKILIGQYAQKYYLRNEYSGTLTETVKNFGNFLPEYFPLPHPSPRNNIWLAKNNWFENETIPELKKLIHKQLL